MKAGNKQRPPSFGNPQQNDDDANEGVVGNFFDGFDSDFASYPNKPDKVRRYLR